MAKASSRLYPQFKDCARAPSFEDCARAPAEKADASRTAVFEIVYTKAAEKQLGALPPNAKSGLKKKLDAFSRGEDNLGIEKINADTNLRKLRWGNYRLVFEKPNRDNVITVVKAGDRKSVYKDF